MKLFSGLFWAIFLILSGVVFLLKQFTTKQFNVFVVIAGIFAVMVGISLLTTSGTNRNVFKTGEGDHVFTEQNTSTAQDTTAVFSHVFADFSDAEAGEKYQVDNVFGKTEIKLPEGKNIRIKCNCAFGQIIGDFGTLNGFGDKTFILSNGEGEEIMIRVDCVFGQVVFS
ncbi:MAG: hypothetical protein ACOX17_06310 [Christensenellales bacterium]|jgi:predicted membrane protein